MYENIVESQAIIKRTIDILGGLAGCVLVGILYLWVAPKIKKELMEKNNIKDGLMFKMDFGPRVIGNYINEEGKEHTGIGDLERNNT